MRLMLTPRAAQDLEDIFDYSADIWGTEQAAAYIRDLHAALKRLLHFPELGRAIDDVKAGVRTLPAGSHLVIYRIRPEVIEVIRVLHKRMDVGRHI